MANFSAAIPLLKKPFDDLYDIASGALKEKLNILRATSKIQILHKRLWETQRVKTIWNTDRPISLSSFYYPVNVMRQVDDVNAVISLKSLDNLPDNHNIIFGTVGQGKSTLMRYLLGKEIKSALRVPVFCELRNIDDQSLESYLSERFSLLLKLEEDSKLFNFFAEKGRLSIFLDGFDEVDPSHVKKLMSEIEDLAYKYNNCRIIVSSRPDSECKHLTSFHSNKIQPIKNNELKDFYKRITRDTDFSNKLVAAVNVSPILIKDLVNTPLLATLLAISYKAAQKIPLDFAEFYDDLFQILLVRHDGSKLGWRRNRKTKLNDREIQIAFEAFCFATRKIQQSTIDKESAYDLALSSLKECELTSDGQSFLEDIKKITCLLVDEGKKINFVHSSVQGFFAARYIKTQPEQKGASFYSQIISKNIWSTWSQELLFLEQIDNHRYTKYFKLPDIDATLKDILKSEELVNEEAVINYLEKLSVIKEKIDRLGITNFRYIVKNDIPISTQQYSILDSRAFNILFSQHSPSKQHWRKGFEDNPDSYERSYIQIAHDRGGDTFKELTETIKASINQIITDKVKLVSKLTKQETLSSFIDL